MMKEFTIIQNYRADRQEDLLTFSVEGHSSANFMHHQISENLDVFVDGYIIDNEVKTNRQSEDNDQSLLINEIVAIVNSKKYEKLSKINGHYNIIICDKKKNEVVVFTDRYGMRPLFWFKSINVTIISNSFSAICEHDQFDNKINFYAIADFLKFEWVTNDATFFQKINRVSAGTINYFNQNGLKVKQYYTWPAEIERYNCSIEENAEQGYNLLCRAVKRVLKGLSSPGVTLSGGLDTRIITGFINRMGVRPILYHCLLNHSEEMGARGVSKIYNINLETEAPLRLTNKITDLPITYGDGCTCINQFWLNKLYGKIYEDELSDCIIDGFNLDLLLNLYGFAVYDYNSKNFEEQGVLAEEDKENIADIIYGLPKRYFKQYFNSSVIADVNALALRNIAKQCSMITNKDIVHFCRILYLMTRGKRYVYMMPYINQRYCDIRFPGLDYDLIDFCMHLPTNQFRNPLVYLKIFEKYFPELNEIIWAKTGKPLKDGINGIKKDNKFFKDLKYIIKRATFGKIDLETPEGDYNRIFRKDKPFRDSIILFLREGQCKTNGIVNQGGLERLFSDIYNGRNNFFILERLLTIELFFRSFVLRITNEADK